MCVNVKTYEIYFYVRKCADRFTFASVNIQTQEIYFSYVIIDVCRDLGLLFSQLTNILRYSSSYESEKKKKMLGVTLWYIMTHGKAGVIITCPRDVFQGGNQPRHL